MAKLDIRAGSGILGQMAANVESMNRTRMLGNEAITKNLLGVSSAMQDYAKEREARQMYQNEQNFKKEQFEHQKNKDTRILGMQEEQNALEKRKIEEAVLPQSKAAIKEMNARSSNHYANSRRINADAKLSENATSVLTQINEKEKSIKQDLDNTQPFLASSYSKNRFTDY